MTVLLEKVCGYNYVHKLRAISLLEADFNWWNKLVFAKRMISSARASNMILEENFAKKGSSCNDAVMTKGCSLKTLAFSTTRQRSEAAIREIFTTERHTRPQV